MEAPKSYRRRAQATFVMTVAIVDEWPTDVLKTGYTTLVRSLSNMVMLVVRQPGQALTRTTSRSKAAATRSSTRSARKTAFFERLYERLAPLALSHLVINNEFDPDLEPALVAGRRDDRADLPCRQADGRAEPPARPVAARGPARLARLRAREAPLRHRRPQLRQHQLAQGRDAILDERQRRQQDRNCARSAAISCSSRTTTRARGVMLLSVPPEVQPRRVSVDAIEHWMIYTEHPEVGAIIHVHAWIEGIRSTEVNYPCGTRELAVAVANLVREAPDPGHADHRPEEPRHDDHRLQPRRHLRPDQGQGHEPGSDVVTPAAQPEQTQRATRSRFGASLARHHHTVRRQPGVLAVLPATDDGRAACGRLTLAPPASRSVSSLAIFATASLLTAR